MHMRKKRVTRLPLAGGMSVEAKRSVFAHLVLRWVMLSITACTKPLEMYHI